MGGLLAAWERRKGKEKERNRSERKASIKRVRGIVQSSQGRLPSAAPNRQYTCEHRVAQRPDGQKDIIRRNGPRLAKRSKLGPHRDTHILGVRPLPRFAWAVFVPGARLL